MGWMMKVLHNVKAEGMGHDWPKERSAIGLQGVEKGPVVHDAHEYVFNNNEYVRQGAHPLFVFTSAKVKSGVLFGRKWRHFEVFV